MQARQIATVRCFSLGALDVAEDIARGYAEDVAAGAALWALEQVKRRPAVGEASSSSRTCFHSLAPGKRILA